jgi:hypothetical protein
MSAQESVESRRIGFSRFAKQPADRLLYEVMIFGGQRARGRVGLVEVPPPAGKADQADR